MERGFTVFQRADSDVFWVRFSIKGEGQIRKSLGTKDENEAHRKATKIYHEAVYRHENGMRGMQRSFRIVAEEFIEHMHQLSRIGEKRHDRARRVEPLVRRYFISYFGEKPIDAITDTDVTRYLEWRKAYWTTGPGAKQAHLEYERKGKRVRRPVTDMKRTPSLSSQRGEAVVLRQLFAQAAKWGYVGRGLIPLVQVPKVPPSPRPSFTSDEIGRLLKLSNERRYDPTVNDEVKRDRRVLHNYVDLAITTGMRPTELRNLDWCDVLDYEAGNSKKVKDRDIRFRTRGKGKSRVFIPLEWAINPIDDLYQLWMQDHGREPAATDPVFANRAGKRITSLNRSLTALLEAADLRTDHLGKKRDSYSFRHFYISEQLRAGVDVFILARNTGTSPDMIDKFYGQVRVEQFKDALRPSWG